MNNYIDISYIQSMSQLPSTAQSNEEIISDIQSLQQLEQNLFDNLETNMGLTSEQKEKIVDRMNSLSMMRVNLYQTLYGVNDFYQSALSTSMGTLSEQIDAIRIVEAELNQSKKRLESMEAEKTNKIRLVEINEYYNDRYAEHATLMQIILCTLLPVVVLVVLNKKQLLPTNIFYILLIIVCVIGGYFACIRYISILSRDNMNYQEYSYYFNPNKVKTSTTTTSSTSSDPWLTTSGSSSATTTTCVGAECCSSGETYDASLNQCTSGSVAAASETSSVANSYSSVEPFTTGSIPVQTTESMVNSVLTKGANKYKADYSMASNYKAYNM